MNWIAPSEKDSGSTTLEKRLWDSADQFRANSGPKSQEYSAPVLGLIFLRFAEVRFAAQRARLEKASASARRGSRVDEPAAYHAEAMFVVHLMQHKWDENAPFPANKTIAQRMHVSAESARRWAASLEQKGYLKREMRVGATNRFHLKGLMDSLVKLKKGQKPC